MEALWVTGCCLENTCLVEIIVYVIVWIITGGVVHEVEVLQASVGVFLIC